MIALSEAGRAYGPALEWETRELAQTVSGALLACLQK